jgi:hypothetical protein
MMDIPIRIRLNPFLEQPEKGHGKDSMGRNPSVGGFRRDKIKKWFKARRSKGKKHSSDDLKRLQKECQSKRLLRML